MIKKGKNKSIFLIIKIVLIIVMLIEIIETRLKDKELKINFQEADLHKILVQGNKEEFTKNQKEEYHRIEIDLQVVGLIELGLRIQNNF